MPPPHTIFLILHILGLVIGVGGAAATDALFVASVRLKNVGNHLITIMKAASTAVLAGFAMLVVSGVGLVATGSHTSSKFWAKMVVVLIIGINGWMAHRVIFPKLERKVKYRVKRISVGFLHRMSVVAAVSGVSWVTALILGTWKTNQWHIWVWLLGYAFILMASIIGSLLMTPSVLKVDEPESFPVLAPDTSATVVANVGDEHDDPSTLA